MSAQVNPLIRIPSPAKAALVLSAAAGALVASRYFGARKISSSERLAEALLETERLKSAASRLPDASEAALADCAGYIIAVALRAGEGLGLASGMDDPIGASRTHTHPYTRAAVTVLTETNAPEHVLTYAVTLPDIGEVRGTRRVGALQVTGLSPSRSTPDVLQITLGDDYSAQIETEFQLSEALVTGHGRVFGAATLRDNRGNVGRLNIGYDGAIAGTITRNARVVGRFEGRAPHGLEFKPYQIEAAPAA